MNWRNWLCDFKSFLLSIKSTTTKNNNNNNKNKNPHTRTKTKNTHKRQTMVNDYQRKREDREVDEDIERINGVGRTLDLGW